MLRNNILYIPYSLFLKVYFFHISINCKIQDIHSPFNFNWFSKVFIPNFQQIVFILCILSNLLPFNMKLSLSPSFYHNISLVFLLFNKSTYISHIKSHKTSKHIICCISINILTIYLC